MTQRYAIVEAGVVSNVAIAEAPLADNWIITTQAGPGWLYQNGEFLPPPPVVPTKVARIAELKQLLADTDYVALSDYDKSKPEVLTQRQAWREEIRTLEAN